MKIKLISCALLIWAASVHAQSDIALIDAHIHYSHDAWEMLPPNEAVKVLRQAGLKKAFVSSSSDDGTQMLLKAAPDLIVPVLRPYRRRGEIATWHRDPSIVEHLKSRLKSNRYVGIGEFHIYGADADAPVMKEMVALAKQHQLFLHAHSDAEAVERIFAQDPQATVLWAHSGFDSPERVREMLKKYPRLMCDLAFRSDHASGGRVGSNWRQLFIDYPDRFMVGTDTYTPERWYFVVEHAKWTREWLNDLPAELARKIASENAERLIARR